MRHRVRDNREYGGAAGRMARPALGALLVVLALVPAAPASGQGYTLTNLVSDIPGYAQNTDPNLVNPWGIAASPTGPFWVANNHTGTATIYNGMGEPQPLVVTVPPPGGSSGPSGPTGQVFNAGSGFSDEPFIFATENGTISGWKPIYGDQAVLHVDNSAIDAVYLGLASGNNGTGDFLYAANFHNATIDVFDTNYTQTFLSGSFTDPNLPAGYSPFNVQNLGGHLYVTYALQDASHEEEVAGPGLGFVDLFDLNGNLEQRLISQNDLNAPWGLAIAPASFGQFGGDLLVGNFGNGQINAYDPVTWAWQGALSDGNGDPIEIEGLWGLSFGNGGNGGSPNSLYFAAGISNGGEEESHGLFGKIDAAGVPAPIPEPSSVLLLAVGLAGAVAGLRRRKA